MVLRPSSQTLLLPAALLAVAGACSVPIPFVTGRTELLDGTLAAWQHRDGSPARWRLVEDGRVLEVVPGTGDLLTREVWGDQRIHVEFRLPEMPDRQGQARANSGVYVQGRYEVQILDSFGREPEIDGCGAIYGLRPPAVNASRPPGQWQSYDIVFRAPRFDDFGNLVENARITVRHNGQLIHDDVELPRATRAALDDEQVPEGPLLLQDHGAPVQFRNIWVKGL